LGGFSSLPFLAKLVIVCVGGAISLQRQKFYSFTTLLHEHFFFGKKRVCFRMIFLKQRISRIILKKSHLPNKIYSCNKAFLIDLYRKFVEMMDDLSSF